MPRSHALLRPGLTTLACILLAGCSQTPTIAMFGAYFPGWLFCIAGGIVLALVTLFSCVFWLLFFKP